MKLEKINTSHLSSLDRTALDSISKGMAEHSRAIKAFGRQNSQTTTKLMSLSMLAAGPYRTLRQCLAEIDRKKLALQEVSFSLRKKQVEISRKNTDDALQAIEAEELRAQIECSRDAVEGALKDIAALQDAYQQIKEKHNIPDNWDEVDFEEGEIEHHIRQAFTLAYRDVMAQGTLAASSSEYFQQFGIHPYAALVRIKDYIFSLEEAVKLGQLPDIKHFHEWLDAMYQLHKSCPKAAAEHLGVTELITKWSLYVDPKRER